MLRIEKYYSEKKNEWDSFLTESRNGTFLFYRDYMDYHSDRYNENSLMIYLDDKLIALFPANLKEDILNSHGYLTYGGLIVNSKMKTTKMMSIISELINYCRKNGINQIIYKAIPHIYHSEPSEEDLYALFRSNTKLIRREVSSCIYIPTLKIPYNRKNGYNKAAKMGVVLRDTNDYDSFVAIANSTLEHKYGTKTTHSAGELTLLGKRFPNNIRFYGAYLNEEMLGGAVIFQNKQTAHAQYLHSSQYGKELRAMDFIIISLLTNQYKDYRYFDFGYSTEDGGKYLNESLINQKEEYSASAVCYDTYLLEM